ncbi:actin-binding protein WASF3 isoform X1 [Latimeria chalumnae]|uniref:Wiskott-Aldrich syndrome protein family member n=1 Tax=Latimeria chalumnae TaxID=7897 RepID=H2ZWI6_LATCH|nr:PREDICTED: wiskott-Aldrich syndrome protein family member 3 isoform X1 [Latimeria chalumnae]XP_014342111.1 PREDICTED: wiskott-Aldrich syndrome protein family member 3 isoform X1 [Latimeria chalumnae]XP_014342112.1 PREDICTED: wiskott-Aldrich syndrome protein family member 3 isoform X1 [Latimeria chalumnae]XP_014342113.1 PREDICTED: wiskott-Aldrich syndrome protein family member 3 isoform X1 [Latimeria chalumnae]XP_014342115.1 PREDICTED: wiskott-Aldrich syndrome protein family member 3 isoform |eukprot:XP_005993002.1 PREDICTED: wiskott-Aldrich syndrome protein family member 3 isoform X1 [Latimeria chalumnae]
MPLVKRNIEPRHLCRGALPEGITSELECVTNNTLAAIIRQLSSLSKHAEDIFGELFNEANNFYIRANSLQDRIDRLAVKVTQLDSTVEEVSLQDINMRKAFRSSTVQDQQVVSKTTIPNPVADIYNQSDKPPPLNILSPYRDDKKDGLKFYTDPSYFFDLWKEKMLQDTEDKRKEKRRQKEQKRVEGTTREVKKVRKARNRRQEWNMMAYDKELRPDNRFSQNIYHGASSEGSLSPDTRSHASDLTDYSYPATPNHSVQQQQQQVPYTAGDNQQHVALNQAHEQDYRPSAAVLRQHTLNRPQQPPPPPPPASDGSIGSAVPPLPVDYGMSPQQMMEYYNPTGPPPLPPPPVIPSAQTAFVSPVQVPVPAPPSALHGPMTGTVYTPPPPPSGPIVTAPPGPPPPPPPGPPAPASSLASSLNASPMHGLLGVETKRHESSHPPVSDARSDLLAAIRMGIQLKKVQEQREQEAKREPVGNDVATILSRRIAVEYSDSDDDSEFDDNEWSD